MKKFLILTIVLTMALLKGFSQKIKASLGIGSQPNNIYIYLQPDVTQSASIATLQFNIGIDTTGVVTAPTLSVLSSAFSGAAWSITPPYKEGGYWNYNIFTSTSPLTISTTANTEFQAMELQFTNGVPTIANVALVTLPDGGTGTGNALFLSTGTITSDGLSNLYYTRAGVTINNQNSYDPSGVTPGSSTSTAFISGVIVPVKFTGFSATKQNDNALLNWAVANENATTDHYEIERSFDGVDFTKVSTISVKGLASSNTYNFIDENISSLKSSGTIYYRIKQVDKNGQVVFTEIRVIKLSALSIGAYPNPAKGFVSVSAFLIKSSPLLLSLSDAAGKQIRQIQLSGVKGSNINKINLEGLARGSYLLKVNAGAEAATLSIFKN